MDNLRGYPIFLEIGGCSIYGIGLVQVAPATIQDRLGNGITMYNYLGEVGPVGIVGPPIGGTSLFLHWNRICSVPAPSEKRTVFVVKSL